MVNSKKNNEPDEEARAQPIQNNGQTQPQESASEEEESPFESATTPKHVTILDIDLRNLQKELLEYKDKYLRGLAEVENSRKRMQRERQELTKYAIENIIVDFLRPLDNMENALKFAQDMSDDVKNWAYGFQMILSQFKDVLAENGVSAFESVGNSFDPHKHEAVEIIETQDYPSGTIIEEYVRGYRMGDRTIRPARVKVAKAVANSKERENGNG